MGTLTSHVCDRGRNLHTIDRTQLCIPIEHRELVPGMLCDCVSVDRRGLSNGKCNNVHKGNGSAEGAPYLTGLSGKVKMDGRVVTWYPRERSRDQ